MSNHDTQDVQLQGTVNIYGEVTPLYSTSDGLLKVSIYEAGLPTNAAQENGGNLAAIAASLLLIKAKTDNIDVALSTRTKAADTQTISGAVSVSNFPVTQPVSGTFWPAIQPVSGTFWQATQPVSIASMPSTPVTGTFWQAVQAVSGTFWQATQPVSGTFWQATQPVSIASMPSTPVTGTFWQATQPVSGTLTANVGTTNGLALDATLTGGTQKTKLVDSAGVNMAAISAAGALKVDNSGVTQPVSGTFFQATQPVSIAAMPSTPVTGTFWQATQPVSGTVTITPPTLTKGTQGATGLSTQDLKDAGRNATNYFMAAGIAGTNAEVMQLLTGYKGGAAVAATATPAVVTAGKTYRVTSITLSYQSLATAGAVVFRLRANLSGAGVIGSPLVMSFTIGSSAAVAGVTTTLNIPFPDGLEFAAGTGIAVGMLGLSTVGAALASGFGTITIYGYEY